MILLIFLFAFSATVQENHEDIIKKAQTLALQRDREKALQILRFSVEKENQNKAAAKKLVSSMNKIGEMLFTEKGQQLLETAESLVANDTKQAIDVYKEALKIEEGNVLIEARIARAHMLLDECDSAASQLESLLSNHPWHEAGLFLQAQASVCKKSIFIPNSMQIAAVGGGLESFYIIAASLYVNKEYAKLVKEMDIAIKKFPEFSEFYWFRSEASAGLSQDNSKDIEKYNELCNSKSSSLPPIKNLVYSCKNKESE
ncbi:MAG: hypothetical protein KDD37_01095 [Bdellovibrionales bacterium]|nr:hypothetical protein [Bdellovibrionales bacterium]